MGKLVFHKIISYSILVFPAIFIYTAVILLPVLFSLSISFTQWSGFGLPTFSGLTNYVKILSDSIFLHGLRNNVLTVLVSVFGQIPLGFILAYILFRKLVRASDFFKSMIFLPNMISTVVVAILWNQIFSPTGFYTAIMRSALNDPQYVLSVFESKNWAIVPILFVILWMYTGLYMVIFLANMQRINVSTLEAAVIDGATEWQILYTVIIPSMIGVLFVCTVFAISGSFKSFGLIFAMTGGGPAHFTEVVSIYMYNNTFSYYKYGFGSAVSVLIVTISIILILLSNMIKRYFGRRFN